MVGAPTRRTGPLQVADGGQARRPWNKESVMTLLDLAVYLVIAGVCGAIARAFGGGTAGGFLVSILLGFLGAVVGMTLARTLHLPTFVTIAIGGRSFPIVWSIVGGFVLVAGAHALMRPRYRSWR
jgi:uncharacterized membrane protein YeaQ/YmgE (transglycosylase-associated protein family)